MKILKTELPKKSILNTSNKNYDYLDSFKGEIRDTEDKITSVDIGKAFFMGGPKWVEKLFALRNKIVSLFGLKISDTKTSFAKQIENFNCEPGEQMGLFKVFAKTDSEIILGEDDKHLNFRVSLFLNQINTETQTKDIIISTTVQFNNWFGRLYFLPVRPFHKFIVPAMLKGMIKNLENK